MNPLDFLKVILFVFLGSGLGTIFAQKLFEHRLNKKLHRFSHLYTDRLDVIKNLFSLLVRAEKGLDKLLSEREPEDKENKDKFIQETLDRMSAFLDYFDENEIFFDDSVIETVAELRMIFYDAWSKHFSATLMEEYRGTEAWHNAVGRKEELRKKLMDNELRKLKKKLKEEFQKKYRLLEV